VRTEPTIDVGIMQGKEIEFTLNSPYHLRDSLRQGTFTAHLTGEGIVLDGTTHDSIELTPCDASATFSLHGVTIGKEFHWQQQETQTFQGSLVLRIIEGELHAINRIAIEDYLTSVIASEMSGTSSVELLKAHAVISRSWLLAQLHPLPAVSLCKKLQEAGVKWYDREAHTHFDVCADDHCQRYQGVSRKVTPQVHEAIRATRGIVLSYEGEVCDARFSKCCGGRTELYESCWDDTPHPYLSVVDDPFCNTNDPKILSEVLNHYDQSTDFYRWTVQYTQEELSELVRHRGGFDYGDIVDLIPIERGPSGRIVRLQIVGTKATRIIGKELEIRRTLSETHLYSSAFEVEKKEQTHLNPPCEGGLEASRCQHPLPHREGRGGSPVFILHGSGWGHGVGLCQIGAAVMGAKGYNYKEILHHYYPEATLTEWYTQSPQCPSRDDC
jgi:SpoIID/LytB domain protein